MDIERELLKGNTPTLILAILRDGPLHGYAIAREIERRSDNALGFKDGTLYPALKTLEEQGLVAGEWQHPPSGPARRVYEITRQGRGALEKRVRGWNSFVMAVGGVLENGEMAK